MSINMRDPWHTRYILILSKISHRSSYIFMYRLNIEIYLYIIIVNYWNVLNCPSVAVWTFFDLQRSTEISHTNIIHFFDPNESSFDFVCIAMWSASMSSNEEPTARIWIAQVVIASVPVWGWENQRPGSLLALCCSKFFLGLALLLRCLWLLFAWAHVKPLLVSYEHKWTVQPDKPHGLLQCMPALAKARVWLPAWPIK